MAKKSVEYKATEKVLSAIRYKKPIPYGILDVRTVDRMKKYVEADTRLPAIKEIRALACCGLKEALDLFTKYFRS